MAERAYYRCRCYFCGWTGLRERERGEVPTCPRCEKVVANDHGDAPQLAVAR